MTDGTNPLPNATVKLFDSQGVPYRHVLTDTEGTYAFTNVPAGTYTVAAACAGHLMSPGAGLTLTGGDSLQVPLVCAPETTLSLGAIAGLVTSTGLEGILPVAGATITLRDLTGAAVASTTSADDGEFVFYDVADGVYSLLATADGYLVTAPIAVTITRGPSPTWPSRWSSTAGLTAARSAASSAAQTARRSPAASWASTP